MSQKKDYVLFVEQYVPAAIRHVREKLGVKVLLLRDSVREEVERGRRFAYADTVIYVDFKNAHAVAEALLPFQNRFRAVTARGEDGAAKLQAVVPHVPYLNAPSAESIAWALDKYSTRRRIKLYDAKNSIRFTKVADTSDVEIARVIGRVGFPMIVKPSNLQASMLVTICYHEDELRKALKVIFQKIVSVYRENRREQEAVVVAEEFMEGDMYSIDTYVNARGATYHCPMVRVKTGKDVGHGDFYGYLQMTPAGLSKESIEKARAAAEKAIHALGLRSVTAHVELIRIDNQWKVIEIGPRIGGFRDTLYELSFGVDHTLNDVLVRMGKKPIIPKKRIGYTVAMKWFASTEGVITSVRGLQKIKTLASFHSITTNKKVGDKAQFARHGGTSIFNIILHNENRAELLADIRRTEECLRVEVA